MNGATGQTGHFYSYAGKLALPLRARFFCHFFHVRRNKPRLPRSPAAQGVA
jgi:hypothetical protein